MNDKKLIACAEYLTVLFESFCHVQSTKAWNEQCAATGSNSYYGNEAFDYPASEVKKAFEKFKEEILND